MAHIHHPEFVPDPSLSRAEMEAMQRSIAEVAVFETDIEFDSVRSNNRIVAGVDQAFVDDRVISAIVACRNTSVIEKTYAVSPVAIDYIPGLLSFREGGPILDAFETLNVTPDLVLFDGNGQLHFHQVGLATHMGVVLELPSIGVAKRLLCGTPQSSLTDLNVGERVPILPDGSVDGPPTDCIGYAVQTRRYETGSQTINPVYVSAGHRISPETAVDFVLELCEGYKLPEPIRLADRYADTVKSEVSN